MAVCARNRCLSSHASVFSSASMCRLFSFSRTTSSPPCSASRREKRRRNSARIEAESTKARSLRILVDVECLLLVLHELPPLIELPFDGLVQLSAAGCCAPSCTAVREDDCRLAVAAAAARHLSLSRPRTQGGRHICERISHRTQLIAHASIQSVTSRWRVQMFLKGPRRHSPRHNVLLDVHLPAPRHTRNGWPFS